MEGGIFRRRQRRAPVHEIGLAQQTAEQAELDRIARAHSALCHFGGRGAQQPGVVVQALDVAAQPVEIVGDAALQVGAAALDGQLMEAPGRGDLHVGRILGQHPDILQGAVQPAQRPQAGVARRLARQPARQHAIAVAVGADEDAQHHRGRCQAFTIPLGAERGRHGILRHELAGLRADLGLEHLALGGLQHADHDRLAVDAEATPHDHQVEVGEREGKRCRLTQPPHVERRQAERLAEQMLAQPLEERHHRRRLDDARAQRIGERDPAAARGLDHAGDAQRRIGAQLQRIDEGAVEAAQQHVDGAEARQGLD